jgi:hypothetical protein
MSNGTRHDRGYPLESTLTFESRGADAAAWLGVTEPDLLVLVDADIVEPPVLVDGELRFAASQLAQLRVVRDSAGLAQSINRTVHIPARS